VRPPQWTAPLLAVLLVALTAGAAAQADTGERDLNARPLHVLAYHPYPDPQGDPWGLPERTRNGTRVGYMEGDYGAYWYPTTVIDGVDIVEGATSFLETYNTYHDLFQKRRLHDAPVRLFLLGATTEGAASLHVRAQVKSSLTTDQVDLRAVLFEDEVRFSGGNGVDLHRFTVRAILHEGPIAFNATGGLRLDVQTPLDPQWDPARLGVVVSLHNRDPTAARLQPNEVLQATTYRFAQEGPTIQDRRGVLLETLSATWCAACVFGDGAVDELANEFGIPSSKALGGRWAYLRPWALNAYGFTTGSWETGLLAFALAAFLAGLAAEFHPRLEPHRRHVLVRRLLLAGVLAQLLALALLVLYFLAAELRIEYVFSYTRTTYPWYYRLAGLWAGQKGTLLLWAALTGAFGVWFLRKSARAQAAGTVGSDAGGLLRAVRPALLAVLSLFALATLVARVFEPTEAYFLAFRPEGNGLQPVLLTPFMIIHPPLQFVAYALSGVLFATGLAYVATGAPAWRALVRPWVRLNWVVATIGLGLGGLWAYYVLNFGGFWAWDPVETANLIAWFPLTLLLHALVRKRDGPDSAAALFALLTLPLVVFATVATRTGLWVSVHAFTDPSKNFARDPLVRLLNILETSPLLQYLTGLLFATLVLAAFALAIGRARNLPDPRRRRIHVAATLILLAATGALLWATVPALGLALQTAHAITLGRSAALGVFLLTFAAAAVVLMTAPEDARRDQPTTRDWTRWARPGRLLTLGIALLGLALLVIFLLNLFGVNGYDRTVFDARAPYLALPILATIAAHFLQPRLSTRVAVVVAVAAAMAGLAAGLAWPDHQAILTVLPALLLVAYASLRKVVDAIGAEPRPRTRRDTAASALLAAGALAALLLWANPPTRFAVAGFELPLGWGWALPAYALAAFALFAAALHHAAGQPRLARWGCAALLPTIGLFGLATFAGVAALALLARATSPPRPWREALAQHRDALRRATAYALHFALVLGLLGYGLATYEAEATPAFDVTRDGSASVRGYSLQVIGGEAVGHDPRQNLPLELHTHVLVLKDGRPLERATLVYWLVPDDSAGHYDARVTVVRRATEDLYLFPVQVHTSGGTYFDHVTGYAPGDVTPHRVELTVKVLPGVGLVWFGLWGLGLAMGGGLLLGGFDVAPRPVPKAAAALSPRPQPATAP
jgi:cytochrome c-type biogenesis protein CcmF